MTPASKDRAWSLAFKIMVPVSFILAGTLVAHEVRISVLESNRFTQEHGHALERKMEEKYQHLSEIVGVIKTDVAVIRQIVEKP